MAKLFICYHRTEHKLAERLRDRLGERGHTVFVDTEIPPGARWGDEIDRALNQSDLVLVLISKTSITRDYVREEVLTARQAGIPLLPIRVQFNGKLPYDLRGALNSIQYAAWSSPMDDDALVGHIQARLDAKPVSPDPTREGDAQRLLALGQDYRQWLAKVTNTLSIPGLGKTLPIEKAWIRLRAQQRNEEEPAERQDLEQWTGPEWTQLRAPDPRGGFEAEYLVRLGSRIVVSGGPGSGKSTLLRWLAHRFSSTGKHVARVWLPAVLARQQHRGETFEEAIPRVAGDGSGQGSSLLERVLSEPDFLLADGFDECEPHCSPVAEDLVRWAEGHPHTVVIVTTRPIGHDPGMFPSWRNVELLPLELGEVPLHARQLLELLVRPEEVEASLGRFEQELRRSWAGLLAARNPLLLGFLVQLFHQGEDIGQRRADLYRAIIDGAQGQTVPDRKRLTHSERGVARQVLELAGWFLQQAPARSTVKLEEELAEALAPMLGAPPLQVRTKVESALRYWEERRILERLKSGAEEFLTFVHAGLREYAAGCHLAKLPEASCRSILRDIRRQPKWREVILLSAGAGAHEVIIQQLLELDDPTAPASTELLAAAAALDEVEQVPIELVRAVAGRLVPRLETPTPLVAFEATELCLPLAARFPDILGPLAAELCRSATPWTRLAAFRLTLATGPRHVDVTQLQGFLKSLVALPQRDILALLEFPWAKRWPGHHFEHEVIEEGLTFLIQTGALREAWTLFQGFIRNGRLGFHGVGRIEQRLLQAGFPETVDSENIPQDEPEDLEGGIVLQYGPDNLQEEDGERALLETVLRVTSGHDASAVTDDERGKRVAIATLMEGLGWTEPMSRHDLAALVDFPEPEPLEVVLRGMLGVLGLEPGLLRGEAQGLLAQLDQTGWTGLMQDLPRVPAEPTWERARTLGLPVMPLLRALSHPSHGIASGAVELLRHGAGGDEAPVLLEQALGQLDELLAERMAALAPSIWGTRAYELLLPILEGAVTRTVAPLYASLPALYRDQPSRRAIQCLLHGVQSEDPQVATKAAEALREMGTALPRDLVPNLIAAAEHWERKGSWCEEDRVSSRDEFCPVCRRSQFYPRWSLLIVIEQLGGLDSGTALRLLTDVSFKVRAIALDSLLRAPTADIVRAILRTDDSGPMFSRALEQVLALDEALLVEVQDELVRLLRDSSNQVRSLMLRALGHASWVARDHALALARAALDDASLDVRNQAVLTFRALQRTE